MDDLHKLKITGNKRGGTIECDGVPLQGVTKLSIKIGANMVPIATLEMLPGSVLIEGKFKVRTVNLPDIK